MTSPGLEEALMNPRKEIHARTAPANRREWEDALVRGAAYFTASFVKTGSRPLGTRLAWDVYEYDTLRAAMTAVGHNERALIYAVSPSGDSACLARADWPRYLAMRGES